MGPDDRTVELSSDGQIDAIKTWRYLRLAMIVLVVGMGVSIAIERLRTHPGCFQTSISGYYYTPAREIVVGSLVAIGVCLICLKGNSTVEDIFLNLAGMFAPVVALVPTPNPGTCASLLGTTAGRDANIGNNVSALLAVGLFSFLLLGWLMIRGLTAGPAVPALIGYAAAVVAWLVTLFVFVWDRDLFVRDAHYTAAILMFVCMLLVVGTNAIAFKRMTGARSAGNRYTAIAAAMVLAAVVFGILGYQGWDYWLLALETTLIALFAIFWATQTRELWHRGLR